MLVYKKQEKLFVVFDCLKEKKRLEVENRAMKQELVRTKSKICSLKREMSSIQQLHIAQQQVQAQLSAPTIISSRQELQHYQQPSVFTYKTEHINSPNTYRHQTNPSNNDETLSIPITVATPTRTVQSTQTSTRSPPSVIVQFTNVSLPSSLSSATITTNPSNDQQPTRHSFSLSPSSTHCDPSLSPSDEQLRLYLTETLQREKDSAV